MKHCLVFASLISPSKMILFEKKYQTLDTVFHHQMKHLEVRQKYSAARRIFNSLLGVSSGDETLHLMFDILHQKYINGIDKSFQFRPTNDRQVLTLPNSIRLRAAALTKYLVSLLDIAAMLFRHILHLSLIGL